MIHILQLVKENGNTLSSLEGSVRSGGVELDHATCSSRGGLTTSCYANSTPCYLILMVSIFIEDMQLKTAKWKTRVAVGQSRSLVE